MPVYQYECTKCGSVIEITHSIHIKYRNVVCWKCHQWVRVKRLLGTPDIIVKGYSAQNGYSKKEV